MRQYTEKGRVIYDRKFHPFTKWDVLRIAKKNPPGVSAIAVTPEALRQLLYWYFWYGSPDLGSDTEFGEGEFGGGGATRDFPNGAPAPDVLLASDVIVFYNILAKKGRIQ